MFIAALVLAVLAVAGVFAGRYVKKNAHYSNDKFIGKCVSIGGGVAFAVAVGLGACSCIYMQDAGEVKVIRNWGGIVVEQPSVDAGFHVKAPWQKSITYDVRNNVISFVGTNGEDYTGGTANGPQVTINDRSGASANIDIQVNYSLNPKDAVGLYKDYGNQENFVKSVAAVDVRSIPREVAGQFDTLQMLTKRGDYANAVEQALKTKWADLGLEVSQVSVQDIRYPDAITSKYQEAQAAEINKQKALNEQEVAKTEAETKKIKAQGDADANNVLNQSLTDNVLKQKYIDALSNADSLTVVPDGTVPMINAK